MYHYVYILTNSNHSTVYVGVTHNLPRRIWEHKKHADRNSFTARYNVTNLVYYEYGESAEGALFREKQIKSWNRARKNKLVESMNPDWVDLYDSLFE